MTDDEWQIALCALKDVRGQEAMNCLWRNYSGIDGYICDDTILPFSLLERAENKMRVITGYWFLSQQ